MSLVKVVSPNADISKPKKKGDFGFDLRIKEDISAVPGKMYKVEIDVKIATEAGLLPSILPRSSMSAQGVIIQTGTIDEGYRGKLGVTFFVITPITLTAGTRIAQVVFFRAEVPDMEYVDELDETERGTGGFGSTGQ